MTNNPKAPNTNENVLYDEFDNANKQQYYKKVREEIEKTCKEPGAKLAQEIIQKELNQYQESLRNFYYSAELLTHNKNSEFFEDAIREIHPTMKIKTAVKGIIRVFNKVLVQELAETCFQITNKTGRTQIDCDLLNDAHRLIEKRRRKKINVGQLFTHMY